MSGVFVFRAPTKVTFGAGCLARLPDDLAPGEWGVLSSPSVLRLPEVVSALEGCRANGVRSVVLGTISPNSRLSEIESAALEAAGLSLRGIIAVGGGSVIDAGKILRIALRHASAPRRVLQDLPTAVSEPAVHPMELVAIPTTAGTGAEVSKGAIIHDDERGIKTAARGESLIPDAAYIDPDLLAHLPARRAAETGFDVVAHALETYFSLAANGVTRQLSERALEEAPAPLTRLVDGRATGSDRESLALQAWLMGYNLAHASTCLPHRIQYSIGSVTDTSHQAGLAVVYAAWLRRIERALPAKAERTLSLLRLGGLSGDSLSTAIEGLLNQIGIAYRLADFGLSERDVQSLAGAVTGALHVDPLNPDVPLIQDILRESL